MKLREIFELNDEIACFIGFWLNLTVILFVVKFAHKSMKKYNVVLLQSSIIDLLLIVTTITIKPMLVITKGTEYIISNGLFHKSSQLVECLAINIWQVNVLFSMTTIPVAYVFRYKVLCHKQNITSFFYISSISIAFLGALTFGVSGFWIYYIIGGNVVQEAENALSDDFKDETGRVGAVGTLLEKSVGIYFLAADAGMIITISYVICIYCSIKAIHYLRKNATHISKEMRTIQKELTVTMTVQAIVPLVLVLLPLNFQIVCVLFPQLNMDKESVYSTMILSWIPTGNALSVLLFIKVFRRKIMGFLKCGKKDRLLTSSINYITHHSQVRR